MDSFVNKVLLPLGFPGVVLYALWWFDLMPYWYGWLPLPVLALWLSLQLGAIPTWFPGLDVLRKQLQGRSPEGHPIQASLGTENEVRLKRWAAERAKHSKRSERAQAWLGKWYHPEPFHPQAYSRALTIAVIYTLVFWLLPWLVGGSGQLGEAQLLPDVAIWRRWLVFLIPLPLLLYAWGKRRWAWSGWRDLLAFALAGAGVVAGAGAVAVAVAGAGAVAFAGAFAFAGAGAGAVAVAGAFAGAFAFAGAGAVAVAMFFLFDHLLERFSITGQKWQVRVRGSAWLMLVLALYLAAGVSMTWWLPFIGPVQADWAASTKPSFALIFFLACLPWLNAASDYFSVGATQTLLARYQERRLSVPWFLLLDVWIAFGLVLALYASVIGLLYLMQALGWGVDAAALKNAFVTGQIFDRNSPAFWLVLLALTNIVPTLLHTGWALWALSMHWLAPREAQIKEWRQKIANAPKGEGLEPTEAQLFARYLLLDHWVSVALVLSLAPPVLLAFASAIPFVVGWLFSWLP